MAMRLLLRFDEWQGASAQQCPFRLRKDSGHENLFKRKPVAQTMVWKCLKWTNTPRTSGNTRHPFSSHHLCPPNAAFGWPIWTHVVRQACGMLLVPMWATKSLQKNHGIQGGAPKSWVLSKGCFSSLQKCLSEGVCWATGANLLKVAKLPENTRWAFWSLKRLKFSNFMLSDLKVYESMGSLNSICRVMAKNCLVTGQCAHWPPTEPLKLFPALRVSSCSQIHAQPDWLVTWHHAPPDILWWCQSEGNWEGLHRAYHASYAKDFAAVTIFLTTALCVACDHKGQRSWINGKWSGFLIMYRNHGYDNTYSNAACSMP